MFKKAVTVLATAFIAAMSCTGVARADSPDLMSQEVSYLQNRLESTAAALAQAQLDLATMFKPEDAGYPIAKERVSYLSGVLERFEREDKPRISHLIGLIKKANPSTYAVVSTTPAPTPLQVSAAPAATAVATIDLNGPASSSQSVKAVATMPGMPVMTLQGTTNKFGVVSFKIPTKAAGVGKVNLIATVKSGKKSRSITRTLTIKVG